MSQELPKWVEDRLEHDNSRDLQQRHVVEVVVNGDRSYYNVRFVRAEIKGDFDKDTVRSRLDELAEQGVLKTELINRGNIYWLNESKSDWPIPPDVEVEASSDEPTVSDFFSRPHVIIASIGFLGAAIAGVIVWVGTLQSGGSITLPWTATATLTAGLFAMLISYLAIFSSMIVWILDKGIGDLDLSLVEGLR
ncbi:hypothetical protein [Natrialba sp. SSL1]|uniref:hypothetical protein n=1 Tax=Natrialba sp. SSL1 TaxID=1869245 RepID=UPI0008F8789C|nr:hypothetical protein [Natrialba sp. SSL1]OIB56155.1 hypothetical protein BBD46_19300 [Natrialba sp. SSL1]